MQEIFPGGREGEPQGGCTPSSASTETPTNAAGSEPPLPPMQRPPQPLLG